MTARCFFLAYTGNTFLLSGVYLHPVDGDAGGGTGWEQ